MSCRIYQRVIDERSTRIVEELVAVIDDDLSPEVALSVYFDHEAPLPGTYLAECQVGERMRSARVSYDPRTTSRS